MVQRRWDEVSVETAILCAVCSERFAHLALDIVERELGFERLRLRRVWSGRHLRRRSRVSHLVCSWEGTDRVRGAPRRAMCGELSNESDDGSRATSRPWGC